MCSRQSFLNSPRAKCLLMASVLCSIVAVVSVVIIVVSSSNAQTQCNAGLECLPISKCKGEFPDFIYSCSDYPVPQICCTASIPNRTDDKDKDKAKEDDKSPVSVSRIQKIDLVPKNCGLTPGLDRISNGVNASQGEFPWMAILGYRAQGVRFIQQQCAGTLINDKYILTAAHCTKIQKLELVQVTLGDLNLNTAKDCYFDGESDICADDPITLGVEKVIPHPEYTESTLKNDIALIRMSGRVPKYTDFIQPICLPFNLNLAQDYFLTRNFTISGWGKTSSSDFSITSILQYTKVQGWDLDRCNKQLPPRVQPITDRQLCATGENLQEACRGDSGGPLTDSFRYNGDIRNIQLGIVSFKSLNTCGTENIPTVFTRVEMYLDWILEVIAP